jgi:hypothetical protein
MISSSYCNHFFFNTFSFCVFFRRNLTFTDTNFFIFVMIFLHHKKKQTKYKILRKNNQYNSCRTFFVLKKQFSIQWIFAKRFEKMILISYFVLQIFWSNIIIINFWITYSKIFSHELTTKTTWYSSTRIA